MAKNNANYNGIAVKAFSIFIAAMFLAGAFVIVDQNIEVSEGKEQQNDVPVFEEEKDIEITVEVYNGFGGCFYDEGSDTNYFSKTYVFKDVYYVDFVINDYTIYLNGGTDSITIVAMNDYDTVFKYFGLEPYHQPIIDTETTVEESVTIEVVFSDSVNVGGYGDFNNLYHYALDNGIPLVLDRDYDFYGNVFNIDAPNIVIDFNGYELINIGSGSSLVIVNNATFIDSYGYGGIHNGSVDKVYSGITNQTVSWNGGHIIIGNDSTSYAGVNVRGNNFTMNGGCIISTPDFSSQGILQDDSTPYPSSVTINDGLIKTANGLFGHSTADSKSTFIINGGVFDCYNLAIEEDFSTNQADNRNIYINGGVIRGANCAIIAMEGNVIFNDGTIEKSNVAVDITRGVFFMYGGTIKNNSHTDNEHNQGLICCPDSMICLYGGTICDNYLIDAPLFADYTKMVLSGSIVIKDNWRFLEDGNVVDENLRLTTDETETYIQGSFSDAYIEVSINGQTEYFIAHNAKSGDEVYFHTSIENMMVYLNEQNLVLIYFSSEYPCGDNLWYHVSGNTLEITGTGNKITKNDWDSSIMAAVQYIEIPSNVTSIGDDENDGIFTGFVNLKEIVIPSSVHYICAGAFYGDSSVEKIVFEGLHFDLSPGSFYLDGYLEDSNSLHEVTVVSPGNWAKYAFTSDVIGETSVIYIFDQSPVDDDFSIGMVICAVVIIFLVILVACGVMAVKKR